MHCRAPYIDQGRTLVVWGGRAVERLRGSDQACAMCQAASCRAALLFTLPAHTFV